MSKNFFISFLLIAVFLFPTIIVAEVSSRPCPYSCKTQGIRKSVCKDWREGNTCYIDDLRQIDTMSVSNLERKIVLVNKKILAGQKIELKLPNNDAIDHLDLVVRRTGGSNETELSVSLGNAISFGSKQVDKSENHVIQFQTNGTRAEGRKLVLTALNGDTFIESVHVLLR